MDSTSDVTVNAAPQHDAQPYTIQLLTLNQGFLGSIQEKQQGDATSRLISVEQTFKTARGPGALGLEILVMETVLDI